MRNAFRGGMTDAKGFFAVYFENKMQFKRHERNCI